jgi:microcystin degradation protein MlrC
MVIVKSAQHFYASFAPIAKRIIYFSSPGLVNPDFAKINFTKRSAEYWPRMALLSNC